MKNLFKKLLACCLAVCMVLTLCVGAVTVSASEVADDYLTVGTVDIKTDATKAVVPVTILSTAGIAAAEINVRVPANLSIAKLELVTEDTNVEVTYASAADPSGAPELLDSKATASEVAPNVIDGVFTYIVHLPAGKVATTQVNVLITFAGTFAEGEIPVTAEVEACKDATSDLLELAITDGAINVAAAHVCTPAETVEENRVEATCYAEGSYDEVVKCSCGKEISRTPKTIEKIAHTPAEAVVENNVAATCYAEGSYDSVVYCSVEACKAEISRTPVTVDKTEHTPATAVVENNKAATCYAEGSYDSVVYCSVEACKTEISRTPVTVEKIAHTPAEAVEENRVEAKPGVAGSYESVVYCSVAECKAEISRTTETIPALPVGPAFDEALGTTCLSKASMTVDSKVNLRYEFGFRENNRKMDFDAVTFEFKKPEWDNNYNFTGTYKTTTLTDADNKSKYANAGIYIFEYNNINLNEMSLKVEATITLYKNGEAIKYYTFKPVSLAERAQAWYKTSLDANNTKDIKMAVDLLNMGTAFQKFFADSGNKKADNVNAGKNCDFASLPLPNVLADTGEEIDQSYASSAKTLTDEDPIRDSQFQLPSIEALSTLTLRYSFRETTFNTPSNVTINSSYEDSLNGEQNFTIKADTLPEDFLKYSKNGIYTYTFDKVPLYDLDKLVTLTVTDGTKTITYQISVLAKVTEMLGKTTGFAYDNFNAIAAFAASCDAYFSF